MNELKRKSTNKQQQHLPIGFTFTKCYISIDTSISNIRLKLLRVILDLNVWPKNTQHTAQTHGSNALSIYLRRFYLFHQIHCAWCRLWIVCYFVIFNTCSRTTDKRNKFHWFFFICEHWFDCQLHWPKPQTAISINWFCEIDYNPQGSLCESHKNYNSRARIGNQ